MHVFKSWHWQRLSSWKAVDSIYYSSPNFLFVSIKVFSFPCHEKLACGLPWLQTLNYSSLLIPNKSIFAGKIPGSLFQVITMHHFVKRGYDEGSRWTSGWETQGKAYGKGLGASMPSLGTTLSILPCVHQPISSVNLILLEFLGRLHHGSVSMMYH